MVPSRSRKTAGRRDTSSARGHLRGRKPATRGCFDRFRSHTCHATVVNGATPQKTRTAVRLFLHHGAPRSDRSGAMRIRRTKDRNDRQADGGGDMHSTGIVADKHLALREQRREVGNCRLAHQTNRRTSYPGSNRLRNLLFGCGSEKDDVRVCVEAKAVYKVGEAIRWPALCGTIGRPRTNRNSRYVLASACR